jgi:hypothetical protein
VSRSVVASLVSNLSTNEAARRVVSNRSIKLSGGLPETERGDGDGGAMITTPRVVRYNRADGTCATRE